MGAYLDQNGLEYFYQQLKKQLTIGRASGGIIHVTDACAGEKAKSLTLYNSSGNVVTGVNVCVTNKNLFRIDAIPSSSTSKGITFKKSSDGGITATGTSTGTYAMTSCTIDKNAFVVGKTYTLSSGKTSGDLYVQVAITYTDGTNDYFASRTQAAVFTIKKAVKSVSGSVQITNSGVTLSNEKAYPQLELGGSATTFENNYYEAITYTGKNTPVLPAAISNLWSNSDLVTNIEMEYYQDTAPAIAYADARTTAVEALAVQLDANKADSKHTHTKSQITDFPTSMPASDVSAWAKASKKPSYTASEVGADASGTATSAVSTHNSSTTAHQDIRNAMPTKVSQLTNDKGYLTSYTETDPTVPAWAKASTKPTYTASEVGAAAASHTHNYAGSSSAGGAATSANKLNTNAGSATQPVYFSNGVPAATTYTLGKSVPSNAVFTDTTYSNFVKSGEGAKAGLVPAPSTTAGTTKYLREDGTWVTPPDTNTTYGNMTAATSSAAGKAGLVPAPAAGKQASFLRGDGTWVVPTNTTYSAATTSANGLMTAAMVTKLNGIASGAQVNPGAATTSAAGLMSASDKSKLDGIASGANAYSLPTATSSVLGGVKTGSNITNSSGTISLTKANVTSALGYTPPTTNTTYSAATTSAAGLMSASDKTKLDGLNVTEITTAEIDAML